jgi:putative oxidoreductase
MPPRFVPLLRSDAPGSVILIRLSVGLVFASEGIQKWIRPEDVGAGRFSDIGIPWPEVMGLLVGSIEIACGALVVVGLFTRIAVLPLIGVMIVAILSTKIPILLGHGYWIFAEPKQGLAGFWDFAHESRTDFAMLLGSTFLSIVGAGARSFDARIAAGRR